MRYALVVVLFESVLAALIFGVSGRTDLPWVWALIAVHTVTMAMLGFSMDSELRAKRLARRDGGPDRRLRGLILVLVLAHLVLAALDLRYGWSPTLPAAVHAAGLLAYTAGMALIVRAMTVNRFFVPTVCIQPERGHETVTAGPYRFLRHPGYAGMILAVAAECFVIGSLWALIPTVAVAAVIAFRTAGEDRMLREQLTGYADYARGVRYRLLPAVW